MDLRKPKWDFRSLLAGAAVGAGLILWNNHNEKKNPERALNQLWVNRALDRRLQEARQESCIRLGPGHRYIILSDHHKGAKNAADDFQQCEATYLTALDYYESQGFTLITLGDAEELLEEKAADVIRAYSNVLECEKRFYPDRLIRLHGNHDDAWQGEGLVREFLHPIFPGLKFRNTLVFQYDDGEESSGEVFLVHGHQGTLDSDIFGFLAKYVLPLYRDFQIRTGSGRTTPSKDACLRSDHDNRIYRWTRRQGKLIVIAGHTHRPEWSSMTHLDKLLSQFHYLQALSPEERPVDYPARITYLKNEIKTRQAKYPPCNDMVKTRPCYFNTGCCRFEDGDITGIELVDGTLRLVKWGNPAHEGERSVLEEAPLSEIFFAL